MIKFTINKTAFLDALHVTKQAISSKIAIPILSKMKITVNKEGILLTASNGQISIEKLISKEDENAGMLIESEGTILLEANFFESIIAQLPEIVFKFEEIENEQVLIRSGKVETILKGQPEEFYPLIQQISSKSFGKVAVAQLKEIFNETSFAASTQETRPILTGVHLALFDHQNLIAVATDSHRLSQRYIKLENFGEDFEIVLPRGAVNGFRNIFNDDKEILSIYLSETQILFKTASTNLYSRLIEGIYPDTDRLIPEEALYSLDVSFDVSDLSHAMNRAKLMTSGIQNGTVKLTVTDDSVTVSANTPEIGSFFEEVSVLEKSGENIEISFNPQFLSDALKVIKEPTVRIRFISAVRPFTIVPKEEGENFIQLITPIRTN